MICSWVCLEKELESRCEQSKVEANLFFNYFNIIIDLLTTLKEYVLMKHLL